LKFKLISSHFPTSFPFLVSKWPF